MSRRLPVRGSVTMASLLFLLLCLAQRSMAQLDPVSDFCRRFGHQTAVIDNRLYIDGGFINYSPLTQYPANYSNTALFYQDLDVISSTGMPQLFANVTKNNSIPDVHGGFLWADDVNKRFYLFGGEYYSTPPPAVYTLYGYDHIYGDWNSFGVSNSIDITPVSYGAGVSVSSRGEGYYFGGWLSNNSVSGWSGPPVATNGLIKFSMDSNSWTNTTGPDNIRRAEGVLVYIPAGDAGLLVYFGGGQDLDGNGTLVGQPMEQIFIYDVLSSKWYTQNATGTVPGDRGRFCAGATWADDRSSYNIYLYGGASYGNSTSGYDDVYVLSLPSFQWFKLYPTDGIATGAFPHHSLTCDVIANAQMLVIGGTFPLSTDCDVPTQWGTHNMVLSETNDTLWALFTPGVSGYAVPSPVVSAVGGSVGGGATATAPVGGFAATDLSVLLTRTASVASRTPTRAVTGATNGASSGGSTLSTGAIVGIAVGGAAALFLALAGCCIFLRRHRRRMLLARGQIPPGAKFGVPPGGPNPWGATGGTSPYSPTVSPYTPSAFTHPLGIDGNKTSPPPVPGPHPAMALLSHPVVGAPSHPAELAAMPPNGTNVWVDPTNGVRYELVPPPVERMNIRMGGPGGLQPRVDPQGRLWVPSGQASQPFPRTGASPLPGTALGSPSEQVSPTGASGVAEPMAPVELSSDPLSRSPEQPDEAPAANDVSGRGGGGSTSASAAAHNGARS